MRALLGFVSVLVTAGACSFSADYAGTRYQCGAGDTCPSGFACVAGACLPAGQAPDGGGADGAPATTTWRSDTADDFRVAGATTDGAVIAARGAVEPAAYYTGGVLESAVTPAITDAAGATWAQVTSMTASPGTSIARSTDVSFGGGAPQGVGLTVADNWTLLYQGEVWLAAGDWTFYLYADDHGFLDVADATGAFARVVNADYPNEGSGTFHAASDGWYPLRWTDADTGGNASIRLRFQGPGVSSPSSIPRYRLRARMDGKAGLVEQAFDGELFDGDRSITLDDVAPAAVDWGAGAPSDLGLSGTDDWSQRWSGQWWVETAGTYTFHYVSDDGQRLWIDGAPLTDDWGEFSHDDLTGPVALDAGWHDVVIDHSEHVGDARALLTVDSGPELVGAALPVDRLRPVEGRGERYEHSANHSDLAIPDASSNSSPGVATSTISPGAPPGAVVHGVEVGLFYDHDWQGDLRITLVAPSGKSVVLRDQQGNSGGSFYEHDVRTDLDGEPAGGTWTVKFADMSPGGVGTIRDVELTVHTQNAGAPPIVPAASYLSPVHDLGGPAMIGAVRWGARAPAGTSVVVAVRAGATEAECLAAQWTSIAASGAAAGVTGEFVQYQVDLTSDGDHAASLDWIEIDSTR